MIDQQSSDEQLVEILHQHKIGDRVQHAMDELYDRYANKMLEYFYYSLNKDREKAKDFVQDLFLKLIEKPASFDSTRKFKPWFYSIASNMCKNEYRKIGTENKYNEFLANNLRYETDQIKEKPFSINEAINYLKNEHKNLIILRYKFKMSIREISEILQCPEGTVRSRLFYATKELSKYLKQ